MSNCCYTPDRVNAALLVSGPQIAAGIYDFTMRTPSWLGDGLLTVEPVEPGVGIYEQLIFRGEMPQIERGFDKWATVNAPVGCDPCDGPNCGYNWTTFPGYAWERKITQLQTRDFRTPDICVNDITSARIYEETFAKMVENLYRQVAWFKEFNIAQNALTSLAKKFVVDSDGIKPNPQNPYVYRPIGSVRLSTLNIQMLTFLYEQLRRIPDAIPFDIVDGRPVFAIEASDDLLSRLWLDDANLRQDARFSAFANDLLTKYNFMSTIRGMFIPAPILFPRRFNVVNGTLVEVLPVVNGVPADAGTYTYTNPAYMTATHEEVLVHGRAPFKILAQSTPQSLGENTSFGPEVPFMDNWMWVNPQTISDPARRVGFFFTTAKIGIAPQFSEGIYGIVVERASVALSAMFTPNPVCPVTPPTCNNSVPAVGCPCPVVLSITPNPMEAGNFFVKFAATVEGTVAEPVNFFYDNGTVVTGELVEISADGKTAEITFAASLDINSCSNIVSVLCGQGAGCSSTVLRTSDCRSGVTGQIEVVLQNAIRAVTAGNDVLVYFGDCTTALMDVVSVDGANLTWTLRYATGYGPTDNPTGTGGATAAQLNADLVCDRGGIQKVCVPPTTDATCPACSATETPCEVEINEEGEGG